MAQFYGAERPAAVVREVSKLHSETHHGTLAELIQHFTEVEPKGEIVLLVGGKPEPPKAEKRNKYKEVSNE